MEEIKLISDGFIHDYLSYGPENMKERLVNILVEFEKKTKEEFLKRILPEKEPLDNSFEEGFNTCRRITLNNASKEGVTIK